MENAVLIGLSRQVALARELDVVANNIANINTSGFKADGSLFQEYLMPGARAEQFPGSDQRMSYVQDRATWLDFSQGAIQQTGNPLDIAVDADAFFVVQTPRGERYTRNGALQLNAAGELVTSDGHGAVGESGPIKLQDGDQDITVAADGSIRVREGASATTDSSRGKLRIVRFDSVQRLQKDGSSLFVAPADMRPQAAPQARVVQGAIEKSNVHAVVEMTRMIEVTRNYSQIATLLQQQGDLRRSAIERLAEVPA
jgi:flagellar basal-body rod protein FlgF